MTAVLTLSTAPLSEAQELQKANGTMIPSEKPDPPDSAAKLALGLITAMAIYLYFGGWRYAATMFWGFGVTLSAVDIPTYYLIGYAFNVFGTSIVGALLFAGIAAGWYALARYQIGRWLEFVLAVVMFTLPFYGISALATKRAQMDEVRFRSGEAKEVRLFVRDAERGNYSAAFLALATSGDLAMLLQTKERIYVFRQPQGTQGAIPIGTLYVLPASDFSLSIEIP